jgi:hypothetical protein
MQVSQQIVGVNQRLGNTAVPNMQGTTRMIFDSQAMVAATNQTLTFFNGVSSRLYPNANINSNKFEVGESLAIQTISFGFVAADPANLAVDIAPNALTSGTGSSTFTFNFYIGNQRVIKDLDLNYARYGIGEAYGAASIKNVFHLETPIIIPPQIEFYATVRVTSNSNTTTNRFYLFIGGTGTLLNTKSNF